jgi:hypothetical protein
VEGPDQDEQTRDKVLSPGWFACDENTKTSRGTDRTDCFEKGCVSM